MLSCCCQPWHLGVQALGWAGHQWLPACSVAPGRRAGRSDDEDQVRG